MATERRSHMQRRGTMDEICYIMDGLQSGEFEVCEEENEEEQKEGFNRSQLDRRLDKIGSMIDDIRQETESIRMHAILVFRGLKKFKEEHDNIELNIDELEIDIDDFDMFNRANNVLIIGLPEYQNEDSPEATLEFFREKLDLHFERHSVLFAQRISQKRHLLVQFSDSEKKDMVIHARRKLKGSGISIYEDLSPRRFDLLNRARSVDGVNAWTVRGRITAIKNYVKYRVDSMADISKLKDTSVQSKSTPKIIFRYKMI